MWILRKTLTLRSKADDDGQKSQLDSLICYRLICTIKGARQNLMSY